eukprot:CAMPEP_0202445922 /NCGR_PEP_ID=MMETSP1360-20130828/4629_1 /ASSEMBLY_ACC=CAM_ASM_000848 /TAXON_ID=515479 /ORGANISM="Licmophora paradoxa, Strain CCMP2313" /LENGTH=85 /DNA_ID=CAMNT_0049062331 /DNA_START=477 /DNA_END=734 /DNA_ORIENTATION=-
MCGVFLPVTNIIHLEQNKGEISSLCDYTERGHILTKIQSTQEVNGNPMGGTFSSDGSKAGYVMPDEYDDRDVCTRVSNRSASTMT